MAKSAPVFSLELSDCVAKGGNAARFICTVDAHSSPTIEWFKDGKLLKESRQYSFLHDASSHTLIITESNDSDVGEYKCVAKNSEGSASSTAKLKLVDLSDDAGDSDEDSVIDVHAKPVEITSGKAGHSYAMKDEIGRGKFGIVKRCIDISTGQEYAAKFITCMSKAARDEILHEVNIMNELNHKRLLRLQAVFDAGKEMVLVMELITGGELFEKLIEEEYISEGIATFYIKQLLDGLAYMHSKGILHLDLKPENMMLIRPGSKRIKIIDYGIARKYDPNAKLQVMQGTPEFAAPETVAYECITPATDVWAVGVITYVVLSGLSPFLGDDDGETVKNVSTMDWEFDDEIFDEVTEQAKDFISRILVRKPCDRMTLSECQKHPWLGVKTEKRLQTQKRLKAFLARRKWKKAVTAVRSTNFLSKILKSAGGKKDNSAGGAPAAAGKGSFLDKIKQQIASEEAAEKSEHNAPKIDGLSNGPVVADDETKAKQVESKVKGNLPPKDAKKEISNVGSSKKEVENAKATTKNEDVTKQEKRTGDPKKEPAGKNAAFQVKLNNKQSSDEKQSGPKKVVEVSKPSQQGIAAKGASFLANVKKPSNEKIAPTKAEDTKPAGPSATDDKNPASEKQEVAGKQEAPSPAAASKGAAFLANLKKQPSEAKNTPKPNEVATKPSPTHVAPPNNKGAAFLSKINQQKTTEKKEHSPTKSNTPLAGKAALFANFQKQAAVKQPAQQQKTAPKPNSTPQKDAHKNEVISPKAEEPSSKTAEEAVKSTEGSKPSEKPAEQVSVENEVETKAPDESLLIEGLEPQQVNKLTALALTVKVKHSASTKPKIVWKKDGKIVHIGRARLTYDKGVAALKITRSENNDAGLYSVEIESGSEKCESSASVVITDLSKNQNKKSNGPVAGKGTVFSNFKPKAASAESAPAEKTASADEESNAKKEETVAAAKEEVSKAISVETQKQQVNGEKEESGSKESEQSLLLEKLEDQEVTKWAAVTLTAKIQNSGTKPKIVWKKDGKPVSMGRVRLSYDKGVVSLKIMRCEYNDSGVYTVQIDAGSENCESSATVEVSDIPQPPFPPTASEITANSVKVTWRAANDGNTPITSYLLEYRASSEKDWTAVPGDVTTTSHLVEGLSPKTRYNFRVSATNKRGSSKPSRTSAIVEMKS